MPAVGTVDAPDHEHAFNEEILRIECGRVPPGNETSLPVGFSWLRLFETKAFLPSSCAGTSMDMTRQSIIPKSRISPRPGLKLPVCGGVRTPERAALRLAGLVMHHHADGAFLIAGEFIPGYAERLLQGTFDPRRPRTGTPERSLPALMRECDILTLPESVEEGSALVTVGGSRQRLCSVGFRCSGRMLHAVVNALVHAAGDVETFLSHVSTAAEEIELLRRL